MDQTIAEKAKFWATDSYFDESDRKEIQTLIDANDEAELTERFHKELEFGTGGMRSHFGMGANRLNKYTVRKATQSMANALRDCFGDKELKVCLSYDSRNSSDLFSKEVSSVFAANGIKCFLFDKLQPTPLLSYAVRHMDAQGGVMITASHNPPSYNGYKAYWADGCQVTPPNDKNIVDHYNNMKSFNEIKHVDFDKAMADGLIQWMPTEVETAYYQVLEDHCLNPKLCSSKGHELKVVYTPLHGTGGHCVPRALKQIGINDVHCVKEQEQPDGNFPTTQLPNPEDPKALTMAVELMKEIKADIAIANDPDADRLGVVVAHNGEYKFPNGNQIGLLMLHYIFKTLKEQNKLPENAMMIKTIVTSELQAEVANKFGVSVENTLTGFKWICGRIKEMEDANKDFSFLFGTEESFGYLTHDKARDKDGINASALFAEMALAYKAEGKTLYDVLDELYTEYGFSHEQLLSLKYEGIEGSAKISRLMDSFRTLENNSLAGDEVEFVEDYQQQVKINLDSKEETVLKLPKSNVLGFQFKNGNKLYMRPSGTEPKIKFYIMIKENEGSLEEKKSKAYAKANAIESYIKEYADKI